MLELQTAILALPFLMCCGGGFHKDKNQTAYLMGIIPAILSFYKEANQRATEKEALMREHKLFSTIGRTCWTGQVLPESFLDHDVFLCCKTTSEPFEHDAYFVKIKTPTQSWMIHFAPEGKLVLEGIFIENDDAKILKAGKVTPEILMRIDKMVHATNFSHCLRNSEHITRYIFEETWESMQMQIGGKIRKYFESILAPEHKRLLATMPSDLVSIESPEENQPLFNHTQMVSFEHIAKDGLKLTDKAYNLVLVGPTGAGKSMLTNLLFNRSVCETKSKESSAAVTRTFQVVQGKYTCDETITINVVDTMGCCDQYVEDEDAISHLSNAIFAEGSKIDKVVIMVSNTPISAANKKALKALLDSLHYSRIKDNVIFLYNKTEKLDYEEKIALVERMGKDLDVDINHKIQVAKPDGMLEIISHFKAGRAVGVDTANLDSEESKKTILFLKEALLPQCASVLQSPKRIGMGEGCCIQ
eukprot:GFUD01010318.1.p1 GENE.GFUD01010318.1~~GFUD01010318.1.p1  ORF type:complete len:473 (+),score=105.48 GFUD01010318.1:39-1457(+)